MSYTIWGLDQGTLKCNGCGALVVDRKLHDAFHEGLHSTSLQAQSASAMTNVIGLTNVIGPKPNRDDAFDRHGWST